MITLEELSAPDFIEGSCYNRADATRMFVGGRKLLANFLYLT